MAVPTMIDGEVTRNVGTRIVHDDDKIRIWELNLAPGEQTDPHEHVHDYIIIILEGDRIAAVPHPKSTGESASLIDVECEGGGFYVMKKGGIETALNTGKKYFKELLIELKDR